MKLRIRGNSVRFRLSQKELEQLIEAGSAEDSVQFAPGVRLAYRVSVSAGPVQASFDGGLVAVSVPPAAVERWSDPAEVSIEAQQALGGGRHLKILIEKDFACLTPRAGEDQADLFPNPAAAGGYTR
jgi:hypothetical protein